VPVRVRPANVGLSAVPSPRFVLEVAALARPARLPETSKTFDDNRASAKVPDTSKLASVVVEPDGPVAPCGPRWFEYSIV